MYMGFGVSTGVALGLGVGSSLGSGVTAGGSAGLGAGVGQKEGGDTQEVAEASSDEIRCRCGSSLDHSFSIASDVWLTPHDHLGVSRTNFARMLPNGGVSPPSDTDTGTPPLCCAPPPAHRLLLPLLSICPVHACLKPQNTPNAFFPPTFAPHTRTPAGYTALITPWSYCLAQPPNSARPRAKALRAPTARFGSGWTRCVEEDGWGAGVGQMRALGRDWEKRKRVGDESRRNEEFGGGCEVAFRDLRNEASRVAEEIVVAWEWDDANAVHRAGKVGRPRFRGSLTPFKVLLHIHTAVDNQAQVAHGPKRSPPSPNTVVCASLSVCGWWVGVVLEDMAAWVRDILTWGAPSCARMLAMYADTRLCSLSVPAPSPSHLRLQLAAAGLSPSTTFARRSLMSPHATAGPQLRGPRWAGANIDVRFLEHEGSTGVK
ncbi:hypothetical protein K438DRAFT_1976773 [Mycena galopus ATCC 62051]|nr:hypothetical protein K438DRAFT_1976773 [Mycena galopus ATCC 62051]